MTWANYRPNQLLARADRSCASLHFRCALSVRLAPRLCAMLATERYRCCGGPMGGVRALFTIMSMLAIDPCQAARPRLGLLLLSGPSLFNRAAGKAVHRVPPSGAAF